ncbi:hypothetical protein D1AOALGA4SA_913 [Olavius algarvensis Delta 1 endosymbiont]|nr:hypothetical protein D1AOALGA4SA_913 [Olavius algarvensis Delta 1 endosymbiont]
MRSGLRPRGALRLKSGLRPRGALRLRSGLRPRGALRLRSGLRPQRALRIGQIIQSSLLSTQTFTFCILRSALYSLPFFFPQAKRSSSEALLKRSAPQRSALQAKRSSSEALLKRSAPQAKRSFIAAS